MAGISTIFIIIMIFLFSVGQFIMTLLPFGIILFEMFSILGIIAFYIISKIIRKYIPKIINSFKPEKVELSKKIIEIILWIITIFISLGAYIILFSIMVFFGIDVFIISISFLILIVLQIINIIILKILKKGYKNYLKIVLTIEPYIMLLILTIMKK